MKTCSKCGVEKDEEAFGFYEPGKRRGYCKECGKAAQRKYRSENPERVKGWKRQDYERHAEENRRKKREARAADPEKYAQQRRQRYMADPEKYRAKQRAWAAANREYGRAYNAAYRSTPENTAKARERTRRFHAENPTHVRDWLRANPERKKTYNLRSRAIRAAAPVVDKVVFDEILQRDLGICGICQKPIMDSVVHIDHIVPLARGGEHSTQNVQLAHPRCNTRKGARVNYSLADAV